LKTFTARRARSALASLAFAFVLAVPGPASALPDGFWDIQPVFEWVDPGETIGDTFNLKTPGTDCFLSFCDSGGFDPGTDSVVEAYVSFIFFEWGDLKYRIELGEGGVQRIEADTTSFWLSIESETLNDDAIFDLNQDGELAWSLTNLDVLSTAGFGGAITRGRRHHSHTGDSGNDKFKLKYATLHADTAAPMPEPGAALLFAVGLGVVGTAGRRRRSS
jgi:hypothetical protein